MNIGLVLSGGMAKGAYQIGALKAISKYVPLEEISCVSGASIGVLNGYAYATGNLQKAEQLWNTICDNNTRMIINQILRSSLLQHNIAALYDKDMPLHSTFYASLLDIDHRNIIYKDLFSVPHETIPLYLKASVSMPVYNKAVPVEGQSYYDGAMVDNIPVFPLLKHDLDYIICLYFDDTSYKFENTYFDDRIIKITFPCETRLKQSITFQQDSIEDMIQSGYDTTNNLLKIIFAEGYQNLDYIYHTIKFINRNTKSSNLRITGDVLVTNLNRITQRLTKRKVL